MARLSTLLKLTISIGLITLVAWRLNWLDLSEAVRTIDPTICLLAIAVAATNLVLTNLRWYCLMPTHTRREGKFLDLFELSMGAMFYNTFVPGGVAGDVVRGHGARRFQMTGPESYASVVTDRFCGLFGLLILAAAGSSLAWSESAFIQENAIWLGVHAIVPLSACIFLSAPVSRRILAIPWPARLKPVADLYATVANYATKPEFYRALGLSLFTGLTVVLTVRTLSIACHIEVAFFDLLWMVPTVGILSAVPISISGWGLREAGYVFFFQQIGMLPSQAIILSVSYGALLICLALLCGMFYALAPIIRSRTAIVPTPHFGHH